MLVTEHLAKTTLIPNNETPTLPPPKPKEKEKGEEPRRKKKATRVVERREGPKRRKGFKARQVLDMLGVAMSMHDASVDWSGERHAPIYVPCEKENGLNLAPLQAHLASWRGKQTRIRDRPSTTVKTNPNHPKHPNPNPNPTLTSLHAHADKK